MFAPDYCNLVDQIFLDDRMIFLHESSGISMSRKYLLIVYMLVMDHISGENLSVPAAAAFTNNDGNGGLL